MCGIFALLNTENVQREEIYDDFMKGQSRGPESSKLTEYSNIFLGFHRLAINGLNDLSNQPIVYKDGSNNDIVLICNGEIYNYRELYGSMNVTPITESDCEVIIHLYIRYGMHQTLVMLDGVFSFVLLDNHKEQLFVARDPFGVRPLYMLDTFMRSTNSVLWGFSSELKCLNGLVSNLQCTYGTIKQFTPGTYKTYYKSNKFILPSSETKWYELKILSEYHKLSLPSCLKGVGNSSYLIQILAHLPNYVNSAVIKRCETTERPVACLLSGGLDSSLIAALVANYFRGLNKQIETYSIGLEGSEDIRYARMVADYIGSKHTEVIVTEDEMFEHIPAVIYAIESYDTTTVRASIGNYLIGKYISTHSDAKVIFNGDGSDELFGGYLYMNKCPDDIEFDKETRRLLSDIYMFDVLRSDKCISSHGLEPRTPFLDRSLVNYVLSIPPGFRNHNNYIGNDGIIQEKYLLRRAFNDYMEDSLGRKILPDEILWRRKEAFSDGVSKKGRSLFTILQDKIREKTNNQTDEPGIEIEKAYYKKYFESFYKDRLEILPYYWMPKYTETNDPSARTLTIY